MVGNQGFLEESLARLASLQPGQKLRFEDLDLALFWLSNGLVVEREDRRLFRPLEIWLWKRTETNIGYDISSRGKRYALISDGTDWHLAGGEISPDNLNGNHYLRMPLVNFSLNTEARLYSARNENVFSVDLDSLRPEDVILD